MEAEKEHRRQRREAIKSQKVLTEPPRLGKLKYEKAPVQVGRHPCPVTSLASCIQVNCSLQCIRHSFALRVATWTTVTDRLEAEKHGEV